MWKKLQPNVFQVEATLSLSFLCMQHLAVWPSHTQILQFSALNQDILVFSTTVS